MQAFQTREPVFLPLEWFDQQLHPETCELRTSFIGKRAFSRWYYPDGTHEWRTLAEVARHMNCSREYCRQVVQRALRKLRKTGIQSGLVETTP